MPTQTPLGMNPMLALLPPDQQQNLMQLQQQQAIGQALLQQGLQPIDTSGRQVGGMGYRISPLEGLAKMANMYIGNKLARDSMGQQAQIMGQMYGNAFGGGQQAPQATQTDAGGMTDGQSGAGVVSAPIATPGAPSGQQLGAAMGGAPTQGAPQTQMPNGALTLPGRTPQQSMLLYSMLGPEAYGHMLETQTAPTSATLAARQGGFDPMLANQAQFRKDTYVAPTTGTGIMRNPFTQQPVAFNPEVPAGAAPLFDASGNVAAVQPINGAQGVMQGNAAATAAGGAQFKPVQVYNPRTHQMEFSNEAAVTNPGGGGGASNLPTIFAAQESSGGKTAPDNPFQIQQGTFKQYAQPGESWNNVADRNTVAQRVLATYNQKYGGDLGRVATAYFSGEGNVAPAGSPTPFLKNTADSNGKTVASYVGDIYSRAGGGSQGGAPAAAPPLGEQANAEAQAKGQIDTMQKSYQNLQTVRSGAPAALQDVDNMSKLAQGANPLTIGPAGAKFAGLFSANAAEYEKSRDNLVTNLGSQLGINSDAARDLVYGSIPSYGAPKQAVQNGLQTLRGQIQTRLLKSDYLSDAYAAGDAKSYNQRENQFDQNITPAIANQISVLNAMPAGSAKVDALKALKGNAPFEWAASNGVLK